MIAGGWAPILILLTALGCGCTGSVTGAPGDAGLDAATEADGVGEAGTDAHGDDGSAGDAAGAAGDGGWEDPPTVSQTPPATDEVFLNPERGFYRTLSLVNYRDYGWVRQAGSTLAYSYVRLDDYRERDLDTDLLGAITEGMQEARQAGIKIILRFSYNFGPYPNSEPDASKDWILRHIQQLEPVLRANADVIAVQQAGFIGAWGEWHTSTNGLLDDPQDKFDILEAVLAALPVERMTQLRYPPHKQEGYGGPLEPGEAYSGSLASRIGHHNDCFLASDTDMGTYPSNRVEYWKSFLEAETRFTPMGGETCSLNPPRSDCPTALEEMERLHYSYINHEYHPGVVSAWGEQGCRAEMERRLGYRLVVSEVIFPPQTPPGGVLPLGVRLGNQGWAAPFNPRPVWVVFDGPSRHEARLPSVDPRRWTAAGITEIRVRIQLPAGLEEGTYTLALWLPDASESLRHDPRYAVRLANQGTWVAVSGWNALATVEVSTSAPGSVDPQADRFQVLD